MESERPGHRGGHVSSWPAAIARRGLPGCEALRAASRPDHCTPTEQARTLGGVRGEADHETW